MRRATSIFSALVVLLLLIGSPVTAQVGGGNQGGGGGNCGCCDCSGTVFEAECAQGIVNALGLWVYKVDANGDQIYDEFTFSLTQVAGGWSGQGNPGGPGGSNLTIEKVLWEDVNNSDKKGDFQPAVFGSVNVSTEGPTSGLLAFNIIWKDANGNFIDCDCNNYLCWDGIIYHTAPATPNPVTTAQNPCNCPCQECEEKSDCGPNSVAGKLSAKPKPNWRRHGARNDWVVNKLAPTCNSCSGNVGNGGSAVKEMVFRRYLIPSQNQISSVGRKWYFDFDFRITAVDNGDGSYTTFFFDPVSHRTFVYEDDNSDGVFESENTAYFGNCEVKNGLGSLISNPLVATTEEPGNLSMFLSRRNGCTYEFEMVPISSTLSYGRLVSMTDQQGQVINITYKQFANEFIAVAPDLRLQIDQISDPAGNVAYFEYHPDQKGGQWAVSSITINEDNNVFQDRLKYDYNSNGMLATVTREHLSSGVEELISAYTYGADSVWQSQEISWYEKAWTAGKRDTLYVSSDYMVWDALLVNQFTDVLVGRANGDGERYMSFCHSQTTPGLHRIWERGRLVEWAEGLYVRYFKTFTQNGSGFDSYSGTMESTYAHHLNTTAELACKAEPPTLVSETGYQTSQLYDTSGNPTRTTYPDGTYTLMLYDSNNQVRYYRDRAGYVTTTERDANQNVIRIASGLVDQGGTGTPTPTASSIQQIYGYYPDSHVNKRMLKWKAVGPYVAGSVVEPPANERTDYEYYGLHATITAGGKGQLKKIIKPLPAGQTQRPSIEYQYYYSMVSRMINENGQATEYEYDFLGRLVRTKYADNSEEQVWYDDANDKVYRKNRVGVVDLVEYDTSGRMKISYQARGHDTDILDGQLANFHGQKDFNYTAYSYLPFENQSYKTVTNRAATNYEFDYRNRPYVVKKNPRNGMVIENRTNYVDNLIFSTEETFNGYTRRKYMGHSADQLTVRTISTRTSATTFADNNAVLNATRLSGVTDPDYIINDAIRDVRGNLVQLEDGYLTKTRNEFDELNRQTSSTRGYGTSLALTKQTIYDDRGRVEKTIDEGGAVTKNEYDDAGNLKSVTLGFGATDMTPLTTEYTYHPDGRRRSEILPGNQNSNGVNDRENLYYFDSCCGNRTGYQNAEGEQGITVKNSVGQTVYQAKVKNFDFNTSDYLNFSDADTLSESTSKYDNSGRLKFRTVWKSPRGTIDPNNPPIAGIEGIAAADGVTTQYGYLPKFEGFGVARILVDLLGGGTTTVDIKPAFNKLAETNANGGASTVFRRDRSGSASIVISPDEKTVNVSIQDGAGRTVMTALMSGPKAATPNQLLTWNCTEHDQIYNLAGFGDLVQTKQIDPDGGITSINVDGHGLAIASLDQNSNLTRSKFDENGNLKEQTNALSKTTTYEIDILGRSTTVTNPLTHVQTTVYSPTTGRVSERKDAKNKSTIYQYDTIGRLKQTTDRTNKITTRTYDGFGNLKTIKDAENRITTYDYDKMNRRTYTYLNAIGAATPQTTVVDYDAAGRRYKQTFHSGESRTSVFEFSGVLDKVEYRNSSASLIGIDDFNYDSYLRPSGSTSIDGIVNSTTYTERGQVDTETTTFNGQSYIVDYDYDARGRLEKIKYPSGRDVDYTYTNRGMIDLISWNGSQLEDRDYDAIGRMTNIDRTAVDEVRVYDDANRLSTITNTNIGTVTWVYDENNNRLSETFTGPLASWSSSIGASGYDAEDRFTNFVRSGQNQDLTLARSNIGNIEEITDNTNSTTTSRNFNEVHQLTSIGSNSQAFDNDGNLITTQTGIGLTWQDGSQRLKQTIVPAASGVGIEGTHSYSYDAQNRRTVKNVNPTAGGATTTVAIHAGPNLIAEYSSGAAPNSPANEYIYAQSVDSLVAVAQNNNSGLFVAARNQQWSVIGLLDNQSGSIAELCSYDVFGKRTILEPNAMTVRTSSNYGNNFGYTSREHGSETGLMYFRARYYDSVTGEFVSQDPLEYSDGMSFYRGYFVLNLVDPIGRLSLLPEDEREIKKGKKSKGEANTSTRALPIAAKPGCCHVFLWLPEDISSVGHAAISCDSFYFSFWPVGAANKFENGPSQWHDYEKDEKLEKRAPDKIIELCCLDTKKMADKFASLKKAAPGFRLIGQNCSSTSTALLFAGVDNNAPAKPKTGCSCGTYVVESCFNLLDNGCPGVDKPSNVLKFAKCIKASKCKTKWWRCHTWRE